MSKFPECKQDDQQDGIERHHPRKDLQPAL
jgi:hypothetical protein